MKGIARRRRGFSMLEMVFAIGLLTGILVLLGRFTLTVVRWNETADRVVTTHATTETLRRQLGEALLSARPIERLEVGPRGELREEPLPEAIARWSSPQALLLRGADAYWVVEREGTRIVRRRIGFDGRVDVTVVASRVTGLTWEVVQAQGRPVGIAYRTSFQGQASFVEGFVALRVEEIASTPPGAPSPAPRLAPEGGSK